MYERMRRELSYIQGLVEGNQSFQNSTEFKVIQRLAEVVDELIETTQKLDTRQAELEEYVESIEEDLNDLELFAYDDEEDDEEVLELTCPECGEDVLVEAEDLEDESVELLCPKCHTVLIVEDASDQEEKELVNNGEGI
ncbi:CD1247 N-terminal domain-containing protein [Paenactinomyces guangxiensis]|uniref:AraC family transcriptional regulator n=1 Tax=Paenactinomyces guangxiensis TaxID=1490290 RepID=A0A7W1WRZ3_9BACL|nr:CD1247 N-terminal domain-containing protein [Paenactinomyces guangxiensis]MBA4494982.1 AraC family transcriptional regulator [Paenactinomyces guangxiensis]MBH8592065.1 hypothetical protein [Paenactinomyces guangxiensis]